jgi:20S proteasome subunit alpha 6
MFRNQYDTDVTTFSPAGRLHQVEYAMEAVKQGSCTVGLKNEKYAIVASLKRATSELASYQEKVFRIDSHLGIGISGLISDARVISQYLRNECLNHRYVFNAPVQAERLIIQLSDKSQVFTQKAEKRPYGVGLLAVAYDKTGTHLFQTEPSGVYFDCYAQAIGARSQSAKTYLEKVYNTFNDCSLDELIKHALTAIKGASQKKLTSRNVSLGIVGVDKAFTILEGNSIRAYVGAVTNEDDEDEAEEKTSEEKASEEKAGEQEEKKSVDIDDEEEKAVQAATREQQREEQQSMGE